MLNCKGYVWLDALAALSVMLFACMALLPIWIELERNRQDLERENSAYNLLYDNLQKFSHGSELAEKTIIRKTAYMTTVKPGRKGRYALVCVKYINSRKKEVSVCEKGHGPIGLHAD
ncbi:MAG: hypothetical protein ACI4XL_04325 [Bacillus sp. (in: firmicutes)]